MNLTIFSDPPSSGKTSVILKTIAALQNRGVKVDVVKFDCLYTDDNVAYEKTGVPVKKGLPGALCPDHFFASNTEEIARWGNRIGLDLLTSESAGLCNHCSPYLKDIKGICVIDSLSGINIPKKVGPLLRSVDVVITTKGDIVSRTERGVLVSRVNPVDLRAVVMHVNGLAGRGAYELGTLVYDESKCVDSVQGVQLHFPMPAALCSYCLGGTRTGENYQLRNVKKMDSGEDPA